MSKVRLPFHVGSVAGCSFVTSPGLYAGIVMDMNKVCARPALPKALQCKRSSFEGHAGSGIRVIIVVSIIELRGPTRVVRMVGANWNSDVQFLVLSAVSRFL